MCVLSRSHFTTDGQSVSQYVLVLSPLWDLWPDITVRMLLSCFCGALFLTRMDLQFAVQSLNGPSSTEPVTVLYSHLRLPQPKGPGSCIYIPQENGGPVMHPGTGFPWRRLLQLAGLRWRYSNPPSTWRSLYIHIPQEQDGPVKSQSPCYM
jgi:hypothetical protein